MCELERTMKVQGFFVMDENFLLNTGTGPCGCSS